MKRIFQIFERMLQRDIRVVAGGLSFFVLLSVFPLFVTLASVYGLVTNANTLPVDPAIMAAVLPPGAAEFVVGQLRALSAGSHVSLSIGLVVSLLLSAWSGLSAGKVLIEGFGIATHSETAPGILRYQFQSLSVTLIVVFVLVCFSGAYIATLQFASALFGAGWHAGLAYTISTAFKYLAVFVGLMAIYRLILPRVDGQTVSYVSGALWGALAWLVAILSFNAFVSTANLASLYGAISAVIVFQLWVYVSAYAILFGAVIARRDESALVASR